MKNIFKSILEKYDTDKNVYEKAYEESFCSKRNDVKLVFEIGVNRGGSLRSFRDYFPNAIIVGIDIKPHTVFASKRIRVEIGNVMDKEFIDNLLSKYGHPDIVIDDGSHLSNEIKTAYNLLYPYTKFCYVIEDLGTQYNWKYATDGVPATIIVHQKIDELMQEKTISSIKFYHSICFIFK